MPLTDYYKDLGKLIQQIEASDQNGTKLSFSSAAEQMIAAIIKQPNQGGQIFFIGNGGSAAIASHMAIDYWKNGKIRATSFNDGSLLTCLSNDFGYEQVFIKAIEMFAGPNDILIAISSSGQSANIINGVQAARQKGLFVITLSGFSATNPLSKKGDLNFFVPSKAYSHVEIIHETICHYILDVVIKRNSEGVKND